MALQNVGKELCHLGGWENKGSNYHFSQHIFASVCVYSFPGMSQETEQFGGICRYLWKKPDEGMFSSLKLPISHSHTAQFRSLLGVGLLGQRTVKHSGLPCPCTYRASVFFGRVFFFHFFLAMTCENESSQSSYESRCKILEQISLQH